MQSKPVSAMYSNIKNKKKKRTKKDIICLQTAPVTSPKCFEDVKVQFVWKQHL